MKLITKMSTEKMIQNFKIKQLVALIGVAFILGGCARGKEFTVVESERVSQSTQYPEFTKPKAAANQFTDEEKEKLTKRLDSDKHMVKASIDNASANNINASGRDASSLDDVRRETDDVLRQIEQSGTQQ